MHLGQANDVNDLTTKPNGGGEMMTCDDCPATGPIAFATMTNEDQFALPFPGEREFEAIFKSMPEDTRQFFQGYKSKWLRDAIRACYWQFDNAQFLGFTVAEMKKILLEEHKRRRVAEIKQNQPMKPEDVGNLHKVAQGDPFSIALNETDWSYIWSRIESGMLPGPQRDLGSKSDLLRHIGTVVWEYAMKQTQRLIQHLVAEGVQQKLIEMQQDYVPGADEPIMWDGANEDMREKAYLAFTIDKQYENAALAQLSRKLQEANRLIAGLSKLGWDMEIEVQNIYADKDPHETKLTFSEYLGEKIVAKLTKTL